MPNLFWTRSSAGFGILFSLRTPSKRQLEPSRTLPGRHQDAPKTCQDAPDAIQGVPETLQDAQRRPNTSPRASKMPPSCPRALPKRPQEPPQGDFLKFSEGFYISIEQRSSKLASPTLTYFMSMPEFKFESQVPISLCQTVVLYGMRRSRVSDPNSAVAWR